MFVVDVFVVVVFELRLCIFPHVFLSRVDIRI